MNTAPPEVDTVLAPVDGSDESATAIEYAVAVAEKYGALVHVVYVLGEEATRTLEVGDADPGVVAEETRSFVELLAGIAEERGVEMTTSTAYGFSTSRKTVHPGSVILDTADQIDADFVVVPREPVAEAPAEVLEKAAEYVLEYASQPVLSV